MTNPYRTKVFVELRKAIAEQGPARQLACSVRAERLRHELHEELAYGPAEIAKQVLGEEMDLANEARIQGRDAIHDLSRLIDDLTRGMVVAVEDVPERVYTTDELAERWNVSVKTVSRWRTKGLVARTFSFDGRARVGFLASSVEQFVEDHPELVRRGSRFSRVTEEERQHILRRGREMLEGLATPTEVVSRLATDTQRSAETIRQLLKQAGILDEARSGTLSDRAVERLEKEFRRGKTIDSLVEQFGLPKSKVRLAINQLRAQRIQELPLDYMPSDEFKKTGAKARILAPLPDSSGPPRTPRKPADLPAYIASLYDVPLLTSEQETHLFRQYNFLKYEAVRLREQLDPKRPSGPLLDQIEQRYGQVLAVHNQLVRANLRLVVSVAKKYVGPTGDLFEKVSEGNVSLMRAVEKFDYTRGFKFSTYATWAIKKNFTRAYANTMKHADRFRTGHDELLDSRVAHRANPRLELDAQRHREQQVASILRDLSDRERAIICSRYGMGPGAEPKTLQEVGDELGVSKERIRQLESRAMRKLREAAAREHFEDLTLEEQYGYQSN